MAEAQEVKKKVKAEVTGGLRFATVSVNAQSIPVRKSGGTIKGERMGVVLDPSDKLTIHVWFKGGTNAEWSLIVTINGKEWKKQGHIKNGSFRYTYYVPGEAFGLGTGVAA